MRDLIYFNFHNNRALGEEHKKGNNQNLFM